MHPWSKKIVPVAITIWLVLVVVGFTWIMYAETLPGKMGKASLLWPAEAGKRLHDELPMVAVFLHPRCRCSEATLAELENVRVTSLLPFAIQLYFYVPPNADPNWLTTDLWDKARAIPGAKVLTDMDGHLAKAFGALTSGHVFMYDKTGHLLYNGGITPTRAQRGDSVGKRSLLQAIDGLLPEVASVKVFGCGL